MDITGGTMADLRSLSIEQLNSVVSELGEKSYRAGQIYDWIHNKGADSLDLMTNLPKSLKEALKQNYMIFTLKKVDCRISQIDGTRKYLFELYDGNIIESVLLRYDYGNTVCISSQVGCRMGCRFCASTLDGLERNLTAGEMLGQIYEISKDIGERIGHVVIMGSGEPLDNYDNLINFIRIVSSQEGINLSTRNITVSTCGLVPKMYELADANLPITLAVSLHAVSDEKRRAIMPIAKTYSLDEIFAACKNYFEKTGRRVTCEYSLIAGENDTAEDANGLIGIAKELGCHINLIPVNPIKERNYRQSAAKDVLAFKNKLEKNHINVTIRREMGRDIEGACGQLRRSFQKAKKGDTSC